MTEAAHVVTNFNLRAQLCGAVDRRTFFMAQGALECQHCGECIPHPGGAISFVVAVSNAFIAMHAGCKARKKKA
jgi:hypothetical protein